MHSNQCTEQTKWPPFVYKCTYQPNKYIWNVRRYENCNIRNCILRYKNIDLHIILESSIELASLFNVTEFRPNDLERRPYLE